MTLKRIIPVLIAWFIHDIGAAQVKTAFGDEVGTLNGIIKAYYDVVSVKKGEKVSFERDSLLHAPGAMAGYAVKGADGKVTVKMMTLRQFHNESDPQIEKDGFYEAEIGRRTEQFGAVYHVWSSYETRNMQDGPVLDRGINSIQLYFDGQRFWILSWVFDNEANGNTIPKKYLKKSN